MKRITDILWKLKLWKDNQGQDLIEYADGGFCGDCGGIDYAWHGKEH
jgi:hypothetical protein